MLPTILYIFCAADKHEQVYGQLNASIFVLQKQCNMFRLPSVAILWEHEYYKTDTELLSSLSTVNGKLHKVTISVSQYTAQ
jgi:hypothetical protein